MNVSRSDYKHVEADLEALRRTPVARSCREAFGSSMQEEERPAPPLLFAGMLLFLVLVLI